MLPFNKSLQLISHYFFIFLFCNQVRFLYFYVYVILKNLRGWVDKFCLHLNRKWTGKDILMIHKKKYAYINYFQSCIIIFPQNHFRQLCTSFWNPSFGFWHSNLLAPILHLWTALPSVLLYSHQHTDHHKRLIFVCEFQLEELFPQLRIQ
jgi:hypothetical protein